MGLYDYNAVAETLKLTPPNKRQTNTLAWLGIFANKIQYLHDIFFNAYGNGSTVNAFGLASDYSVGDRVWYVDDAIYEALVAITNASTTPDVTPLAWVKITDTFVGVVERSMYTGQKIVLEYILNKKFRVAGASTPWTGANQVNQIYITNSGNSSAQFWLSNGGNGSLTSYLSNGAQKNFLGNAYTYNANSFTIYVPTAVKTRIESYQASGSGITYDQVIRTIADKYVQAGFIYAITTY